MYIFGLFCPNMTEMLNSGQISSLKDKMMLLSTITPHFLSHNLINITF